MKHRHMKKKAEGGMMDKAEKAHPNKYNAQGSPESREADDETDDFKRGGKHKKKAEKKASGGAVHGTKSSVRLDKRARGGAMKSPLSSAHAGTMPKAQSSGTGSGHESEQPSDQEPD